MGAADLLVVGKEIDMTFEEKIRWRYKRMTTPELKKFGEELLATVNKAEAGYGAFIFGGRMFTLPPPESNELGYLLIAAQINIMAEAYEKSSTVILSEIAEAIKFLKELERDEELSRKLGSRKEVAVGINAGQGKRR